MAVAIESISPSSGDATDRFLVRRGAGPADHTIQLLTPASVKALLSISAADVSGLAAVATSGAYGDLTGIPSTFAPSAHTHPASQISDATTAGRNMLTAADVAAQTALLNLFTTALKGMVPASGGGTTNFLRADGNWAAPPGGGGGGGGATGGSATLDFGAAPGSSVAEVVITGQASILTGSRICAWVQGSTADHNAYEHSRILPGRIGLGIADVVAATGFTICAETELRLTGEVAVNWEWA